MNCVAYSLIDHKKINGTLFYGFEYFVLLRDLGWDVQFLILNTSESDLDYIKDVFINKYKFNLDYLNNIIGVKRYTGVYKLQIENVIILDVLTYEKHHMLLGASNILVYSNDVHDFLNTKDNVIFYGWYDYQIYNKKNRLKVYDSIHKTYAKHDNKTFISSPDIDHDLIIEKLHLDPKDILIKDNIKVIFNLFEKINNIIYYQSRVDTNNRLIVEAYIHGINFSLYNNDGFDYDSLIDRRDLISSGNVNQLLLDKNDMMIKDFIKIINV